MKLNSVLKVAGAFFIFKEVARKFSEIAAQKFPIGTPSIAFQSMAFDGIPFQLSIPIENTTSIPVGLKQFRGFLKVNDKRILPLKIEETTLNPGANNLYINSKIFYASLDSSIEALLSNGINLSMVNAFSVTGVLTVKGLNIPIDENLKFI